jgi:hypothetical protein
LTFDRLSLAVDDGVGNDDAVGRRVQLDSFELDDPHAAADHEDVSFVNWTVGFQEVRFQIHVQQAPAQMRAETSIFISFKSHRLVFVD